LNDKGHTRFGYALCNCRLCLKNYFTDGGTATGSAAFGRLEFIVFLFSLAFIFLSFSLLTLFAALSAAAGETGATAFFIGKASDPVQASI
jgi:hypothetical protein